MKKDGVRSRGTVIINYTYRLCCMSKFSPLR